MRNLKLLYCQRSSIDSDCTFFTSDIETSKIYVASQHAIFGYYSNTIVKCFEIDLVHCDIIPDPSDIEIVGLQFMYGEEQLCVALKHGDVVLCNTTDMVVECVGTLDSQVCAMHWSPDQEVVLFVTDKGSIVAMTHDFDPISELEVNANDFGEGEFINVGWGKKETQFQGSAGKFVPGKDKNDNVGKLLNDDKMMRVIWRGDGQYFAVSSVESGQRKFRVWNRNCELQYTSENISGLESAFAWKPSGSLIASTQRKAHRHDVVFFELNGLQHGEFTLPFASTQASVIKLEWNCDSSVLLLVAKYFSTVQTFLQLWTVSNYHWSLKRTVEFVDEVDHVTWDVEKPLDLHVIQANGAYFLYRWAWTITCSKILSSLSEDCNLKNLSYVAVIDGLTLKLTPFKQIVVPPPLCAFQILFKEGIQSICFAECTGSSCMGVLTYSGNFICFANEPSTQEFDIAKIELMSAGGNGFSPQMSLLSVTAVYVPEKLSCPLCPNWWCNLRHLVWQTEDRLVGVALSNDNEDCILTLKLDNASCSLTCTNAVKLNQFVVTLCSDSSQEDNDGEIVQLSNGNILKHNSVCEDYENCSGNSLTLSFSCPDMQMCSFFGSYADKSVSYGLLALSNEKRLFLNDTVISNECTSFYIHNEYIVLTTSSHKLIFISRYNDVTDITKKYSSQIVSAVTSSTEISRTVERGASIVTVTPGDTKCILQLPRGNLELIHPRPLVISVVKYALNNGDYKTAFVQMRKHRINMNLLYDHNPEKFLSNVSLFIDQLDSVEFLNLFLSELREEDVRITMYNQFYPTLSISPQSLLCIIESKVDKICETILFNLMGKNRIKYFLSILTAHVRKCKSEIEEALLQLKELKEEHPDESKLLNDALKHLHVMVDGRVLYQESLATYDLDLALMVAQVSNNDPKEYVPFLNNLATFGESYKRYKIDMFLKRYHRALKNLAKCPDHFSECMDLIISQNLHCEALVLFKRYSSEYRDISISYAEVLTKQQLYEEAGMILSRCDCHKNALKCYTKAGTWRHALNSALYLQYSKDEYVALARSLADEQISRNAFADAAIILEEEANDSKAAIIVLCKGRFWSKALHLIRLHKLMDLTDTYLIPALKQVSDETMATLQTYREQFDQYFTRLIIVRKIKEEKKMKNLISGDGDGDLDSDIASDFGSTVTGSSVSSVNSRTSQRTAKSRRKQQKKRYSLKKGSRFEEEGLLKALNELVERFSSMESDVHSLLLHLCLFHMDEEAKNLQNLYDSTHKLFVETIPKIWILPNTGSTDLIGAQSTVNSIIASRFSTNNDPISFTDIKIVIPPNFDSKSKVGLHMYKCN